MRIGLVDCDTATLKRGNKAFFPNLALMKISAWHKQQGDSVEWYRDKMINGHVDKIYVSKVFSFSSVPDWNLDADEIEYGGSGFAISVVGGVEVYDPDKDKKLPYEIEHIYPDYELYKDFPQTHDTAYGFLQHGCPASVPSVMSVRCRAEGLHVLQGCLSFGEVSQRLYCWTLTF